MLADVFDMFKSTVPWPHNPHWAASVPLFLFLTLIHVWTVWQIWKFTISPLIWRDEPPMLPYWIPHIGHYRWWAKDSQGLYDYGNKYFKGDGPFAIMLGGHRFVLVRNPTDVRAVWNNNKTLTFDDQVTHIMGAMGIPPSRSERIFKNNPAQFWKGDETNAPFFVKENPAKKPFYNLQENLFKEQLLPGMRMDSLSKVLMHHVSACVLKYLENEKAFLPHDGGEKGVILLKWCQFALGEGACRAMLGPEIFKIDPQFTEHYLEWENLSWKIALSHPGSCDDVAMAGEELVQTLMKYYSLAPEQRPNISWWFDRLRSEQIKLGFTSHDVATFALIMLWGVNLNTSRMCYWTMAHTLASPEIKAKVIEETAPAFLSASSEVSITHLMKNCPTLNAVWLETTRCYASSSTLRNVIAPTIVGGKKLVAGDYVLAPFRMTHFSEAIFGPDAGEFHHERWLNDEKIQQVKGFNPFGGGHMYCPGRTLAKQEVLLFVARVLNKYDIDPVGFHKLINGKVEVLVPKPSWEHVLATLLPDESFPKGLVIIKEKK